MTIYNKGIYSRWAARFCIMAILMLVYGPVDALSQESERLSRAGRMDAISAMSADTSVNRSIPSLPESLPVPKDTTAVPDSIAAADSIALLNKSSLDVPAFTAAKDSIIEDFSDGKKLIYYYGDVSVTYGNMKLTADYMEYDLNTGILYARGTKDPNGTTKGQPVMQQGGKSYSMEEVRYNFNTQKARITNMLTQEQDGILHGKNIKMLPDKSINITK